MLFAARFDRLRNMFPEALFVTGTDTGVGKTVVAAAVTLALREKGWRVATFKPVETGIDSRAAQISDTAILCRASGFLSPDDVNVYRLSYPLAPAVAAELEGIDIDVRRLVERFHDLRRRSDGVIVEGVGGVMVPIRWDYSVLDLIAELNLPVLLVARAGLGTVNHTALTYAALRDRGMNVWAVILNRYPQHPGWAERTNPDALRRLLSVDRIFTLPACSSGNTWETAQTLARQTYEWLL